MYACGLRVGEATTLEVTAVDRARRVLRIVGKGEPLQTFHELLAC